jgi:hypothetical protein
MRKSLVYREDLRDSIRSEIAERTKVHQARVAALKAVRPPALAAGAGPSPLVMLAHGVSWFDYPLDGNGPLLQETDVIAQLQSIGNISPLVLNVSHFGDATSEEMSWPKQQRMIDALKDPNNWPSGKPDAILFSGGGDDIAGNQFCIFLNYADSSSSGLNATRLHGALQMVQASYQDLFAFRDRNVPGVPIFGHCYDFAIPNGIHPLCAGPWLLPSLQFAGWNVSRGTTIVHDALLAFRALLLNLASDPGNNFVLVDTQGTLQPSAWANELHPTPEGFKLIAAQFASSLRLHFTGRI